MTSDQDDFIDQPADSQVPESPEGNAESVVPPPSEETRVEVEETKPPISNTILSFSYELPAASPSTFRVTLPSMGLFGLTKRLNEFNKLNLDPKDPALRTWRDVSEKSIEYFTVGGMYQDRFDDPKSKFMQGVETKEGELDSIGSVKFKQTDGELKGEIALLKVSKMLGLGDVMNVPLPHSGIWVTIKPPTEKDLIDFYNSVFREKIMLGRTTYGLTLTNFSVHINNRLFDFILRHVHSLNYSDIPKEELKNYIKIHDFPILAWGFVCTMYPNGFDYQRPCVNDIETCTYIAKAAVNLAKLLWIDNNSLSTAQKVILSESRPNKHTVESYRKYIAEHSRVVNSSFTAKNGMKFRLKVPTFNEYTIDGMNWINRINTSIEHIILEETADADTKTEMLNQYVKSSILRQFNHFFDSIEFGDNVINDRDTINQVLEALSSDDTVRGEITEEVLKFKADTTIGLIGIPEYKCPHCHKEQNTDPVNDKFVNVIPLDVMALCFLALTSKISRILEREV